jgi:hypothetical protein
MQVGLPSALPRSRARALMSRQADEYIERAGLAPAMKDAVLLLLENRCATHCRSSRVAAFHSRDRPADPILFLAEYFETLEAEQSAMQVRRPLLSHRDPLLTLAQRTLHYIKLAPPQRPSYM